MAALGAYLRTIRRARGYSQESLAEAVETSKRTIERLERYEGDITVPILARIIATLGASPERVHYLAMHSAISEDDAEAMAKSWLRGHSEASPSSLLTVNADVLLEVERLRYLDSAQIVDMIYALSGILRERRGES